MFSDTTSLICELFNKNNIEYDHDIEDALSIPKNVALVLNNFDPNFPFPEKDLTKKELNDNIKNIYGSIFDYNEEEEEIMSFLDIVDNIRIFPQTEKNRKEASEYLEELRKSSINTLKEAKSRISQFTESPKKKPNSF